MRGLFLNGFYSSIGNMKLFLFIVIPVAFAVLVTGSPTAQEIFVYLTITALSVNAIVSSRKDAASKWNKYEITLPLRRKEIVTCKYLSYLFWLSVGSGIALVITVVTMLLHKNSNLLYGLENFYSMFALGMGISLFTAAFFYPLSYLIGLDKSETLLIISVLFAVGLSVLTLTVLNQFGFSFGLRMFLFVAFYLLLFVVSYGATQLIYLKKEF